MMTVLDMCNSFYYLDSKISYDNPVVVRLADNTILDIDHIEIDTEGTQTAKYVVLVSSDAKR